MGKVACLGGWWFPQFLFFRVALKFSLSIFFFAPSFLLSCLRRGMAHYLYTNTNRKSPCPQELGVGLSDWSGGQCLVLVPLLYFIK